MCASYVMLMKYSMYMCSMCRDWCVGSVLDETCTEMWYALWFVRFREPIDMWTHTVMFGRARHMYVSVLIVLNHKCYANIVWCVSVWCRVAANSYWYICVWACQYINHKSIASVWLHTAQRAVLTVLSVRSGLCPQLSRSVCSWSHACTPAKFKHIGKRRSTHNVVCLQSLRTNKNYIAASIICMCIELLYTYVMPILVWV